MKLQNDVTAQNSEVQRLRGKYKPVEGAPKMISGVFITSICLSYFTFLHFFANLLCVCMVVLLQTEQLMELKQEFMKQEEQLREVRKNSTNLERKLEYERYLTLFLLSAFLKQSYINNKKKNRNIFPLFEQKPFSVTVSFVLKSHQTTLLPHNTLK